MDDEPPHGPECSYLDDLAAGYALGAVEPPERARIGAHLDRCPRCQALIADLRRAVALLPFFTPPVSPSAEAKHRLMSRIERARPAITNPAGPSLPPASHRPEVITPIHRFHPALSAVPLAAVLLGALVWSFSLQHRLNLTEDQLDDVQQAGVTSLLNAPMGQATTYTLEPMCAGCQSGGRLKASPDGEMAMLVAWALDPDTEHEVWILTADNTWLKLATLDVSSSGDAMQVVDLTRPLSACQALAVSSATLNGAGARPTPELMVEPISGLAPAGTAMLESWETVAS
ncbi:MAG: zf-HC2 domain-containing protein [Chloroflexia bacterium]|nr:zf-HC2 domain-containing protein [Chloroflexia bacterium]